MKIPKCRCCIKEDGFIRLPEKEFKSSDLYTQIAEMLGYSTATERIMGILCMNEAGEFIGHHILTTADFDNKNAIISEILLKCAINNSMMIHLIGNKPGEPATADDRDLDFYEELRERLRDLGIGLFDSIIAAGDGDKNTTEYQLTVSCLIMSSLRVTERHPEEAKRRLAKYLEEHPEERERCENGKTTIPVETECKKNVTVY